MTGRDLRERFLAFFAAKQHTVLPSDGLVPNGDPTVLFTSAGMNQFKEYFLGKRTDLTRAASCQKCLRTGDLDAVGDASHHSFFEMLGNFSFGEYFKRDAIQWAWEFLTGTMEFAGKTPSPVKDLCVGLPAQKLWVSIYQDDDEAAKLWQALGVPAERIKRFGQDDNFWPANAPRLGPNGPCGPCSEIYFTTDGTFDKDTSLEVWNLVFTQFDRQPDGSLKPLPKPNIDTGMGLERLTRVVQGTPTDYETDLFRPLMDEIAAIAKKHKVTARDAKIVAAQRAVADHARAITLLLAEGVMPSNEGRGYVLRMLIRRTCLRIERGLGVESLSDELIDTFKALARAVEAAMQGSPYAKELAEKSTVIANVLAKELPQFQATLQGGRERLGAMIERLRASKQGVLAGDAAFELYDTYGLPFEVTVDIASEQGITVDRKGFDASLKAQQERSRAGSQFGGDVFVPTTISLGDTARSEFVGYQALSADGAIRGIWKSGGWVDRAQEGDAVGIILDRSPFYGESGGQIGDQGTIDASKGAAQVSDTKWADRLLVHHAKVVRGTIAVGDPVRAQVDAVRRTQIARSHTAAHLLHSALRRVLGPETVQAGSLVELERVRFDFSSLSGLHAEQQIQVEQLVNQWVLHGDPVQTKVMGLQEAKQAGALALFGEKYGSDVRVVSIGEYSKELCGGTHLSQTSSIGPFRIVAESSIAAGTRRIEALVGGSAVTRQQEDAALLKQIGQKLSRPPQEILTGLEELFEQLRAADRTVKSAQQQLASVRAKELLAQAVQLDGISWITAQVRDGNREFLTALADAVKSLVRQDAVILLSATEGASDVSMVMTATSNLVPRVHVGSIIKAIMPLIQGKGGGRPDFAQGGGKDPAGVPQAFRKAEELVREALTR